MGVLKTARKSPEQTLEAGKGTLVTRAVGVGLRVAASCSGRCCHQVEKEVVAQPTQWTRLLSDGDLHHRSVDHSIRHASRLGFPIHGASDVCG